MTTNDNDTPITEQDIKAMTEIMDAFEARVEAARRRYEHITGKQIRGDLDWEEMGYDGSIQFRYVDSWDRRDNETYIIPKEFLADEAAFAEAHAAEQRRKEAEQRRKDADARRAREARERQQLAELQAKYPDTTGGRS